MEGVPELSPRAMVSQVIGGYDQVLPCTSTTTDSDVPVADLDQVREKGPGTGYRVGLLNRLYVEWGSWTSYREENQSCGPVTERLGMGEGILNQVTGTREMSRVFLFLLQFYS